MMVDKKTIAVIALIIPAAMAATDLMMDGLKQHEALPCHDEACKILVAMNHNIKINNCLIFAGDNDDLKQDCLKILVDTSI